MSFKIYGQHALGSSDQESSTLPIVDAVMTHSAPGSFRYQELENIPGTVRMLSLYPFETSSEELLRGDLIHTDLEAQKCKFTALSYCWGDSRAEWPISINDCTFFLTENLWTALMSLRPKPTAKPILVWADAICINQEDITERNKQVQLMADIYGAAETVAVHLGLETNSTALAVAHLKTLAETHGSQDVIPDMINNTARGNELYFRWKALVEFFALDYWQRLWIVQEVMLPRVAVIRWGQRVIPWSTYRDAITVLIDHAKLLLKFHYMDDYAVPRMNRTWYGVIAAHMESRLDSENCSSRPDLLSLLEMHRYRKCSDPRDKIYALLSLVSVEQRRLVTVDYAVSLTKLFTRTVGNIIQSTRRLDIICYTRHSPVYERPDRLPSWVPDWAYQRECLPIRASTVIRFDASRGRQAQSAIPGGGNRLCIRGVRLDSIQLCSVTCSLPWNNNGLLLALASAWIMVQEVLLNEVDRDERFCQAVIFGSGLKQFGPEYVNTVLRAFRTYRQMMNSEFLPLDSIIFGTGRVSDDADINEVVSREIWSLTGNCLAGRRAFITQKQRLLGVGSGYLDPDDVICVPLGCETPIILKALGDAEYKFVSDAYVCDYMDGRAMSELDEGHRELEEFILI